MFSEVDYMMATPRSEVVSEVPTGGEVAAEAEMNKEGSMSVRDLVDEIYMKTKYIEGRQRATTSMQADVINAIEGVLDELKLPGEGEDEGEAGGASLWLARRLRSQAEAFMKSLSRMDLEILPGERISPRIAWKLMMTMWMKQHERDCTLHQSFPDEAEGERLNVMNKKVQFCLKNKWFQVLNDQEMKYIATIMNQSGTDMNGGTIMNIYYDQIRERDVEIMAMKKAIHEKRLLASVE
jgi:hypothetical protein